MMPPLMQSQTATQEPGTTPALIHLHRTDNVALAAYPLKKGQEIADGTVILTLTHDVPQAHKVATQAIPEGERIIKYGETVGFATADIEPGDWVHSHNVEAGNFERDHAIGTAVPDEPAPIKGRTFMGYRRPDGKAGTRNYIAVISSVNCSASVASFIARRFTDERLAAYPNVDGVLSFTHKGGCAIQHGGEEHQNLWRTLSGIAKHPNIGAYVLVGLGCETATLEHLIKAGGLAKGTDNVPVLHVQDEGGTVATVEAGERLVENSLAMVNAYEREPIPASELIVGLECGGSDGNSGITSNPAIGSAVDRIVAAGGTAILAETPEIYGAEHILTRRASEVAVGEKLLDRIRWWERYAGFFGVSIDNNPTVGNKAGGITTIYEKSMGAIAKAGSTALRAVYRYAEPVKDKGLTFMDTPGYDPTSITGMVAGGAQIILFSTGRGSCFGCKPSPTIKVASNTNMFNRLDDDMDVNAGVIHSGVSVEDVGGEIFETVLKIASGEQTHSERHGIGGEEFCPWSIGPVL